MSLVNFKFEQSTPIWDQLMFDQFSLYLTLNFIFL